ncbi:TPA: hypothetical protein ACGQ50_000774 [Enterobacter cloacae]
MVAPQTFCIVLLITAMAHAQARRRGYLVSCVVAGLGWAFLILDLVQVFAE